MHTADTSNNLVGRSIKRLRAAVSPPRCTSAQPLALPSRKTCHSGSYSGRSGGYWSRRYANKPVQATSSSTTIAFHSSGPTSSSDGLRSTGNLTASTVPGQDRSRGTHFTTLKCQRAHIVCCSVIRCQPRAAMACTSRAEVCK